MRQPGHERASTSPRRRYLVHVSGARDRESEICSYITRICPWAARGNPRSGAHQRVFADEYELISVINPLLPHGSDVRDVFEHIEAPNGFFYLLRLSGEEAAELGWRHDSTKEQSPR